MMVIKRPGRESNRRPFDHESDAEALHHLTSSCRLLSLLWASFATFCFAFFIELICAIICWPGIFPWHRVDHTSGARKHGWSVDRWPSCFQSIALSASSRTSARDATCYEIHELYSTVEYRETRHRCNAVMRYRPIIILIFIFLNFYYEHNAVFWKSQSEYSYDVTHLQLGLLLLRVSPTRPLFGPCSEIPKIVRVSRFSDCKSTTATSCKV